MQLGSSALPSSARKSSLKKHNRCQGAELTGFYSVVEINIAIIVSSVPGFSKFMTVYINKWAPIRTLRSKIYSSDGSHIVRSVDRRNQPRTGRDGSAKNKYMELHGSWILRSEAPERGIRKGSRTTPDILQTVDIELAHLRNDPRNER